MKISIREVFWPDREDSRGYLSSWWGSHHRAIHLPTWHGVETTWAIPTARTAHCDRRAGVGAKFPHELRRSGCRAAQREWDRCFWTPTKPPRTRNLDAVRKAADALLVGQHGSEVGITSSISRASRSWLARDHRKPLLLLTNSYPLLLKPSCALADIAAASSRIRRRTPR
jgi:hypothetical protein